MGCQNSKDSSDPDSTNNALRKKESYRPLIEEDKERIRKVLDYWFVENYDSKAKKNSGHQIDIKVKQSGSLFSSNHSISHASEQNKKVQIHNSSSIHSSGVHLSHGHIEKDKQPVSPKAEGAEGEKSQNGNAIKEEEKVSSQPNLKQSQGNAMQLQSQAHGISNQSLGLEDSNQQTMKLNNKISPAPSNFESEDKREVWDRHSNLPASMMKRWFGGAPNIDQEISTMFKLDLEDVGHQNVRHWLGDRDGKLAIIILCDQYSRNIYRGMAEAFSFDHISL